LREYPVCTKFKHAVLYDILHDKAYYKIDNYIVTQKEMDEFMASIELVFKEEFDVISEFYSSIKKEFKSKINSQTK